MLSLMFSASGGLLGQLGTVGAWGRAIGAGHTWAETDWLGAVRLGNLGQQTTGVFRAFLDAHEGVHVLLTPATWLGTNFLGRAASFVRQLPYVFSPTFQFLEEALAQGVAIWRTLGFTYRNADAVTQLFTMSNGAIVELSLARAFRIGNSGTAVSEGLLFPLRAGYVAWWQLGLEWSVYGGFGYWLSNNSQ